jgi:hypothetical protein
MLNLGGFAFAAPWLLLGFLVLPALWFLLRVTPPPAATISFPALRLLRGLDPPEETPARTPLWLLLLRMALASLLILALARPLIAPSAALPGSGPLLLVIDDDWAAAPSWADRVRLATDFIGRADREGRLVAIVTTAPDPAASDAPALLRPADASAAVKALQPKPWPADYPAVLKTLAALPFKQASVQFLANGIGGEGEPAVLTALARIGLTGVTSPSPIPRLIQPGPADATDLAVTVSRADGTAASPVAVQAIGEAGIGIDHAEASFAAGSTTTQIPLKMPVELRNRLERIDLSGEAGAGATLLLDEGARRRPVGIAGDAPEDSQQPLLADAFYLGRALEPYVALKRGAIASLVESGVGMIVLPDGALESEQDRQKLTDWIDRGGMLVRFAGPKLAQSRDDSLLPVALRRGDRTIGGAMSWEKPAHLAEFPAESPFRGLAVPEDVTVARQVLAEPSPDLAGRTWAALTDGTPLVTAEHRGTGWLVLVHTSANPSWSDLSLSGLFVGMLRRLERLGRGGGPATDALLKPWRVLDGMGRLGPPSATARPIEARAVEGLVPSPEHPPGFYGTDDNHVALNLGAAIHALAPLPVLPLGAVATSYGKPAELDLRPALLTAALLLLLADLLIFYRLRGLLSVARAPGLGAASLAALLCCLVGSAAMAEPSDSFVIDATRALRLAYVKTGDDQVDRTSLDGLSGLGVILGRRTSVETGEPMGIDVEHDELIFFPLIYWPLTAAEPPLTAAAAARVNRYLKTGGTILFDTRDQGTGAAPQDGAGGNRFAQILTGVALPPLVQIPADHVLTKSFYLMQDFPGRWIGGPLWVEPADDRVNDGVSTVVVGSNDWAAAWALDAKGVPIYPVVPGGEQQREMAYRFGVNMVMYALTGNYKADQVHVPAILERLGQ